MKSSNSSSDNACKWANDNVVAPAGYAFFQTAYEPVRTLVNCAARPIANHDMLPEVHLTAPKEAKEFSPAYFAQLISSGAVSAASYAVSAELMGASLRNFGTTLSLEGAAARLMASQSTAQIAGGFVHDGLMDAPSNNARLEHAVMGATAMGIFEGSNKLSGKMAWLPRYSALAATGASVGALEFAAPQFLQGSGVSWSEVRRAAVSGATCSVLLPGAQWGIGKAVDTVNVQVGRGVPISRYVANRGWDGKFDGLEGLVGEHPLSRVQPQDGYGSRVEYSSLRDLIYVGKKEGADALAHELGHKEARKTVEPQFAEAASVLATNPERAKELYVDARFAQEEIARKHEDSTAHNISEFAAPPADRQNDFYKQMFEDEFEQFKTAGGKFRPEHDFKTVSSEVLRMLREKDDPALTINTLYPEMAVGPRKALIQAVQDWKFLQGPDANAFDLTWGLPHHGWNRALTSSIAETCALRMLYPEGYFGKPSGALASYLNKELAPVVDEYRQAEENFFHKRLAAYQDAGRAHEFWMQEEFETQGSQRFLESIMPSYRELDRLKTEMSHAPLEGKAGLAELFEKADKNVELASERAYPFDAKVDLLKARREEAGVLRNDYIWSEWEYGKARPIHFQEESPEKVFSKKFAQIVEKAQAKLSDQELKGISSETLHRALLNALIYRKDAAKLQDRAFWQPIPPVDIAINPIAKLKGLSEFLNHHKDSSTPVVVERIINHWHQFSDHDRVQLSTPVKDASGNNIGLPPLSEAVKVAAPYRYKNAQSPELAEECLKWTISPRTYPSFERKFMQAVEGVPSAFPTDIQWNAGDYHGYFMERRDPRSLFLGEYTNSCNKIGGANERGTFWALQAPEGGFFVVEDSKNKIVAASRVWRVSEHDGITFNNVEAKGLGNRNQHVLQIYKDAAQSLVKSGDAQYVTMGTGHNDLDIDRLPETQALPLPDGYIGLDDIDTQVRLAGSPVTGSKPLSEIELRPSDRSMPESLPDQDQAIGDFENFMRGEMQFALQHLEPLITRRENQHRGTPLADVLSQTAGDDPLTFQALLQAHRDYMRGRPVNPVMLGDDSSFLRACWQFGLDRPARR